MCAATDAHRSVVGHMSGAGSLESGIPGFEFLLRHLEAEGLGASCWTPLGLVSPV